MISDAEMCDAFLSYDKYYNEVVYRPVINIQHQIDELNNQICDLTCSICEYKTQIVNLTINRDSATPDSNLWKRLTFEIDDLTDLVGHKATTDPDTPATGLELNLQTLKEKLLVKQVELVAAKAQAEVDKVQFDDDFLHGKYECWFCDNYPLVDESLLEPYRQLVMYIKDAITAFVNDKSDMHFVADWIYSYMLGEVIGPYSTKLDIHDLLVLLDTDNIDDIFDGKSAKACYSVSQKWLAKLPKAETNNRPATMFGEPHVIKSLRLQHIFY